MTEIFSIRRVRHATYGRVARDHFFSPREAVDSPSKVACTKHCMRRRSACGGDDDSSGISKTCCAWFQNEVARNICILVQVGASVCCWLDHHDSVGNREPYHIELGHRHFDWIVRRPGQLGLQKQDISELEVRDRLGYRIRTIREIVSRV